MRKIENGLRQIYDPNLNNSLGSQAIFTTLPAIIDATSGNTFNPASLSLLLGTL